MRNLLALAVCLVTVPLAAVAHADEHPALSFAHSWIAEPPPGAPVAAGYVVIVNEGETEDRLLSATADFADLVSIHTMTMTDDGVMQMRPHDGPLPVPVGGSVVLEPGGLHIMFTELTASLQAGDSHEVVLEFEEAGAVTLDFVVQKRDAMMHKDGEMEEGS